MTSPLDRPELEKRLAEKSPVSVTVLEEALADELLRYQETTKRLQELRRMVTSAERERSEAADNIDELRNLIAERSQADLPKNPK